MSKEKFEVLFNNRGIKIVGYVFITIFLGAIGSGFWERVLSRWFEYISTVIMRLLSKVFSGYADMLYSRVGLAQVDILTVMPYLAFIIIFISCQWVLVSILFDKLNKLIKTDDDDDDKNESVVEFVTKVKKKMFKIMIPMCVITTVTLLHLAINDIYTRETCIYVERSLDILSPKISETEFKDLRAMYRAVDNASKFYELEAKLRHYASSKSVTLPKFTIIK